MNEKDDEIKEVYSNLMNGNINYISGNSERVNRMKVKNITKLKHILQLPDNWNENGALSFSENLINICENIINILPSQPEIFPTAAHSVQMEYEKDNGEYLEFNVYEDKINVFQVDSCENEKEFEINIMEVGDNLLPAFFEIEETENVGS